MNNTLKILFSKKNILPLIVAFVFFSTAMSGIWGGWGFTLYYPIVIIFAIFVAFNYKSINNRYLFFYFVCLFSIIFNIDLIPSYFNVYERIIIYVFILTGFSGLFNSRKIALTRLYLLNAFAIFCVIAVVFNYVFFLLGYVDVEHMEIYERLGIYRGSTSNNKMGALSTISIMYIVCIWLKYGTRINNYIKVIMVLCIISSISMLGMSSSRMAFACTVIGLLIVVYQYNRKYLKKLLIIAPILIVSFIVIGFVFQDKFRFMILKQQGDLENINTSSRDELWEFRIKEFKESPAFGIGFATINKYGTTVNRKEYVIENQGRIETGSGWLTVLSQTGILGMLAIILIIFPNVKYLLKRKEQSFDLLFLNASTIMFILQPITEGYITAVGSDLCCMFWLNFSVVESYRNGFLRKEDYAIFG